MIDKACKFVRIASSFGNSTIFPDQLSKFMIVRYRTFTEPQIIGK